MALEILGDAEFLGQDTGIEILGDVEFLPGFGPHTLTEAQEDVDLAEEVRAGRISASELSPEMQRRLGISMPGDVEMVGITPMTRPGTEPIVTGKAKGREYMLESPKVLAGIEGLGEALLQDTSQVPKVEEVYDREKTLGEKVVKLGTTIAADLPAIIGAEAVAAAAIPAALKYTGKKLALKSISSAIRFGATGMLYEGAREFGEQMMDPEEEGVNLAQVGKEAAMGLITWGTMGALGPVAGRGLVKSWGKLSGTGRITARINNLGMTLKKTPPHPLHGNKPMYDLAGPRGFERLFGDKKSLKTWVAQAEKSELAKHVELKNWTRYHRALDSANQHLEQQVLASVAVGKKAFERGYHKILGGVHFLAQRVEEGVFGKIAMRRLNKQFHGMGLTTKQIRVEKAKILRKMAPYRLWSMFVEPILGADRLARRFNDRMGRWQSKNINKPLRQLSKAYGRSEMQVSEDVLDLLVAGGEANFSILPSTMQNLVGRWRTMLRAASDVATGTKEVGARIDRVALEHGMSKKTIKQIKDWVFKSKAKPALTTIEKKMGPYFSGKSRSEAFHIERYNRKFAESTIGLDFTNELDGSIYRYEVTALASKARKALNHLFKTADLDPSIWRAAYVPHLRATKAVDFNQAMKGVPKWVRPKLRFFAQMHKRGGKFVADRDIRSLLQKYTWGASRQRYMKSVLERGEKLVHNLPEGEPLKNIFVSFANDIITGTTQKSTGAMLRSMEAITEGKLPFEVASGFIETMWASAYGGAMGFRPFLILRNLVQPWITTNIALATHPTALTKAYIQAMKGVVWKVSGKVVKPSGRHWDDFIAQNIHMKRGGGLPFGEEIFRELSVTTPEGMQWKALVKSMGAWRAFAHLSTKGYQVADTINRFVSYRAARNAVEGGVAGRKAVKLANHMYKEVSKVPKAAVRGKLTAKDVQRSQATLVNKIVASSEMNKFLGATGVRSMFNPTVGERSFARPLVEQMLEKVATKKGEVYKLMESPKSALAALKRAVNGGTTGDSLSRRMARQFVGETQWLYQRNVQPQYLKSRIFGMFGTWSANYTDFVRRHVLEAGTVAERGTKIAALALSTATLYTIVDALNIDTRWVWAQFFPPTGGPLFKGILDAGTALNPYTSELEKGQAVKRLKTLPVIAFTGGAELRSIAQAHAGKKSWWHGFAGAPQKRRGASHSAYQSNLQWDWSKLTAARAKKIANTMEKMNKAFEKKDQQAYARLEYSLRETLKPVVKYDTDDPVRTGHKVLRSYKF